MRALQVGTAAGRVLPGARAVAGPQQRRAAAPFPPRPGAAARRSRFSHLCVRRSPLRSVVAVVLEGTGKSRVLVQG